MPNDLPPATTTAAEPAVPAIVTQGMSPAMAIMLNDRLFERAKDIAKYLSRAEGFIPGHLLGKPEACFAVVVRSLTWKLDPYAVAMSTYQTPGGRVGFEGKLCQAILENSGKIVGPVSFEHYGDWKKVQGKYAIKRSEKSGKEFTYPTWDRKDAEGLGVTVRAQVRGEPEPRAWSFDLVQAFPLNSTLWATDPKTQICYAAVRRFCSVAAPGLLMGVPFEGDLIDPAENARDVTPAPAERPTRADFAEKPTAAATPAAAEQPAPDMDKEYRRAMGEYVDEDTGEITEPETEPAPAHEAEPDDLRTWATDALDFIAGCRDTATLVANWTGPWEGTLKEMKAARPALFKEVEAAKNARKAALAKEGK